MKNAILLLLLFTFINYSNATTLQNQTPNQFGFIENKGQIIDQNNNLNPSVLYLYNGISLHVQLKQTGFCYEVMKRERKAKTNVENGINTPLKFEKDSFGFTFYFHRIDISFVNANRDAKIISSDIAPDCINYYTSNTSEEGATQVHHYKRVLYQNIYNNIDVEFLLNDEKQNGGVKYNFIIHPNGNVNDIRLKFEGANNTSLTTDGLITIETAFGNINESIPLSFQLGENNKPKKIISTFKQIEAAIFGISVGNYDATKTLIIDPVPWATYFGGSGDDYGTGIINNTAGGLFVVGTTSSSTAIATSGAFQTSIYSSDDAFIAKFNSSGALQWATYFGGNSDDWGNGIALDSAGNIAITGTTISTAGIATTGSHQTSYSGGVDRFIAKFNSTGTRTWSTYFGGSGSDGGGNGIAIDRNGSIIITGVTTSSAGIATSGAYQTSYTSGSGSPSDAFIAKFDSSGTRLWATYFGGSGTDEARGVATDSVGNIVFTGATGSTSGVATSGSYQTSISGSSGDAFIAKFNTSGAIQWCTYYGGAGSDAGNGIGVDLNGDILITGQTTSTSAISSSGAYQTSYAGGTDAFILKLNTSGGRLWASYFGGDSIDIGRAIFPDLNGYIGVTGITRSISSIATSGAYQTSCGGNADAFIVKFNSSGSRQWSTYYGGSNYDEGIGICLDANGSVFITGSTNDSISGIATSGSHQSTFGGGNYDAYVGAFTSAGGLPVQLIYFDASLKDKKIFCTWTTASEINNNYFSIERSNDGEHFQNIGTVNGSGNSNRTINYNFTDETPSIGISYYRLKQTDFDGKYSYSKIKAINLNVSGSLPISLVYDKEIPTIKFNSISNCKFTMQLFSLSGTTLWSTENITTEGDNIFPLNVNVSIGLYLLKTQLADKIQYFKIWVN